MEGTPLRTAVYARISSDPSGTALGVARQLQDCRRLASELRWPIAEEYIDNDVSAFARRRRPAYDRLLTDISDGLRDAVLCYHVDRLTRRPIEIEHFVEVATNAGLRHVRFVTSGPIDVGNGDGLLLLRVQGAVAANESATKSRRVLRKMEELAQAGRPHGGSQRPFGYEGDRITVRPEEAEVIGSLARRYLAGESLRSLTAWLHAQNITTVRGGEWRTSTLRSLLASGRIAGLRQHRGEIIGPAVWEPIISEHERTRILARMADQVTNARRSPRRYLLSGLLRCGRCTKRLYSAPRATTRRYVCRSGPDHGGCGRLTVVAPPLEELVAEAVLYRLDTSELADALAGRQAADRHAAALAGELARDRAQLDDLVTTFARNDITRREWMHARREIDDRIRSTEKRLARLTRDDALDGLAGNGGALREKWATLNLTRQNAIVKAVLDHAVISPGVSGARSLDRDRVDLVWRL